MPFWRSARLVSTMIVILVTTFSGQSHAISGQECTPTFVETLAFHPIRNGTGIYGQIEQLAWSPDSQFLAAAVERENRVDIQVWHVEHREVIKILAPDTLYPTLSVDGDNGIGIAWSPDSEKLAVAFSDSTVRIWNAANDWEMKTLNVGMRTDYFVAWSPDGRHLLTMDVDRKARLWNSDSGELIRVLHSAEGGYIAATPDVWYLATETPAGVEVQDLDSGEVVLTVEGTTLLDIALSDEVQVVATLELTDDEDEVEVWDIATGELVLRISSTSIFPYPSDVSPDGQTMALVNEAGMRFISLDSGEEMYSLEGIPVNQRPAWSANGRCVAWRYRPPSNTEMSTVMVAVYAQQAVLLTMQGIELAFSPDGTMLAATDDVGGLTIWRVPQGD